jgi:hypothetical protein
MLSPMANNVEMIRGGEFGIEASVRYDLFYDPGQLSLLLGHRHHPNGRSENIWKSQG